MPAPAAATSSWVFIPRCWTGIIRPIVSGRKAVWPGRLHRLSARAGARAVHQFRRDRLHLVRWRLAAPRLRREQRLFRAGGTFEYDKLYDMIHTLQPDAFIHNNRHDKPLPGEDIQGFEQDLPGENSAGFNTTTIYDMPN